jgi:hypothetical protein
MHKYFTVEDMNWKTNILNKKTTIQIIIARSCILITDQQ